MKTRKITRSLLPIIVLTAIVVALTPASASAQAGGTNDIVEVTIQASSITWNLIASGMKGMSLTITGPNQYYFQQNYGDSATISNSGLGDGTYIYNVTLIAPPKNPQEDPSQRGLSSSSPNTASQSGSFTVSNSSFVIPTQEPLAGAASTSKDMPNSVIPPDQVTADDLIVQGSICAGFDCVDNESFGFDTIRLKENNLRIGFNDTSVGAFPTNDWTIVANDSTSGGASFLGFEDVTGAKFPFKVMAGAPTNSLFVSSGGDLGIRTATPILDVHATSSDTPGMRLEQTNAGGFTAQTWDIAGNEANFFVRDVTGGSKLPFRIRPGAPTSSIDIAANGNVGIGTASPTYDLDVANTGASASFAVRQTDGATLYANANTTEGAVGTSTNHPLNFYVNNASKMTLTTSGTYHDLQIQDTAAPAIMGLVDTTGSTVFLGAGGVQGFVGTSSNHPMTFYVNNVQKMSLATNGNLTVVGSVNATAFNPTSDRNAKENFTAIDRKSILERLSAIPISTWNFKENDGKVKHMGPMAQDFYAAFGLGMDDKHIATVDADGVAFAAIQELNQRNDTLSSENATLRNKVDALAARVSTLEASGTSTSQPSQSGLIILLVGMNLTLLVALAWSIRRGTFAGTTQQ